MAEVSYWELVVFYGQKLANFAASEEFDEVIDRDLVIQLRLTWSLSDQNDYMEFPEFISLIISKLFWKVSRGVRDSSAGTFYGFDAETEQEHPIELYIFLFNEIPPG